MALNIERFKNDLNDLQYRGMLLECSMILDAKGKGALREALGTLDDEKFTGLLEKIPSFRHAYEAWYSESLVFLKQILPDRIDAFIRQYEKPKTRKEIKFDNYTIEDFMIGLRVSYAGEVLADSTAAIPKMQNQTAILAAAQRRFESSLFELRQIVQADLFDSEIASARELLRHKFLRGAGAIAGVVLEKHLQQVCGDHQIKIAKKNPGINDLNQLLRDNKVIDVPQWRHITLLADYRNLCDHNKNKEPTEDQVTDLIDGTDKVIRTVA